MDQYEFIEKLKKYGIEQALTDYKALLSAPVPPEELSHDEGKLKAKLQNLTSAEKDTLFNYLKVVIEDSTGIILSLLDGSSNIGQVGGKFQLYYDDDAGQRYHINNKNGDMLMTLLYDEEDV